MSRKQKAPPHFVGESAAQFGIDQFCEPINIARPRSGPGDDVGKPARPGICDCERRIVVLVFKDCAVSLGLPSTEVFVEQKLNFIVVEITDLQCVQD